MVITDGYNSSIAWWKCGGGGGVWEVLLVAQKLTCKLTCLCEVASDFVIVRTQRFRSRYFIDLLPEELMVLHSVSTVFKNRCKWLKFDKKSMNS
jgi:hypothetical protein